MWMRPGFRTPVLIRFAWITLLLVIGHLALSAIDFSTANWVLAGRADWLIITLQPITILGDSALSLVPSAAIGFTGLLVARRVSFARRTRVAARWLGQSGWFVFASIAVSGIIVNLIKILVGRTRPYSGGPAEWLSLTPFSFESQFHSFPSGHAATAFALALALAYLAPWLRVPLLALAAVVAFSRVVLAAHFPSDVLGGAALAAVTTHWIASAFAARGWVFRSRADKGPVRKYIPAAFRLSRGPHRRASAATVPHAQTQPADSAGA